VRLVKKIARRSAPTVRRAQENYTSFTRRHLIPYFGTLPVSAITPEKVEDFIAAKRKPGGSTRFRDKPLSEATLRTGLIALRLILQRAVKAKHVPGNPAAGVGRFPRNDEEAVDPFAVGEVRAILAAAQEQSPEAATFFRLWAQTGTRAGEARSLRWGDVDARRGVVVVQRTYSRGRIGPPKTRRTRAVNALHPVTEETGEWRPGVTIESRAVLTALRRLTVQSLDPEAYVFAKGNGKPWDSATVLRAWKRAVKAAQRPPALRAAPGGLAERLSSSTGLRSVDAPGVRRPGSTIRNPGATDVGFRARLLRRGE